MKSWCLFYQLHNCFVLTSLVTVWVKYSGVNSICPTPKRCYLYGVHCCFVCLAYHFRGVFNIFQVCSQNFSPDDAKQCNESWNIYVGTKYVYVDSSSRCGIRAWRQSCFFVFFLRRGTSATFLPGGLGLRRHMQRVVTIGAEIGSLVPVTWVDVLVRIMTTNRIAREL